MMKLADKGIKTAIVNMLRNSEENINTMRKEMDILKKKYEQNFWGRKNLSEMKSTLNKMK